MSIQNMADQPWSYDSLWAKTKLYIGRAFDVPRDSDMFPFWASLGLEFLVRATLAHVHPALLASVKDTESSNLLFAFGFSPKGKKFVPKSIDISEALTRCEQIVPEFTTDLRDFCLGMTGRRNEELHSGGLPFDGFDNKLWLSRFYAATKALLAYQKKTLADLIGREEAVAAEKMLTAEADEAAKQVKQLISAHAAIWKAKTDAERAALVNQSEKASKPHLGHVIACPSCGSKSLLTGEAVSQQEPQLEAGELVVRENILPTAFKCEACSLGIVGHSRIHAAGLGGVFTNKHRFDPIAYYAESAIEPEEDYFNE